MDNGKARFGKFYKQGLIAVEIKRSDFVNLINKAYKPAQNNAVVRPGAVPGGSDRLEISAEIAGLKEALAKLPETDPARLEKLAQLARQIENKEYRVDPAELATLLLKQTESK
jgi:anti-sigma28 factor (negative regulator of flagellin synthesis)